MISYLLRTRLAIFEYGTIFLAILDFVLALLSDSIPLWLGFRGVQVALGNKHSSDMSWK